MKAGLVNCREDVKIYNKEGDALLHCLVKKPFTKRKMSLKRDLLAALLTYSDASQRTQFILTHTASLGCQGEHPAQQN